MDQSSVQDSWKETVVVDVATHEILQELEDQRVNQNFPPEGEDRSTGIQSGRPFRGEQKRRPAPSRGHSATPESDLPSSSGSGYYLFQGGNGRTFQPYCWYRA